MFFRRRPKPPLTADAYRRWLRAQRPPLLDFLHLSDVEQEALALLGDEYAQDAIVAIGYALADPRAADAGLDAQRETGDGEESLARRLAADLASSILRRRGAAQEPAAPAEPTRMPRESLAGLGARKKFEAIDKARRAGPTLFGRGAATAS